MSVKHGTIFTGDNLPILRGMEDDFVDLIYLDPPFNSNSNYSAPIGSEAAGVEFKDTWTLNDVDVAWHGEIAEIHPALYDVIKAAGLSHGKGMAAYLIYMSVRLLEMKRVLKETGSIYLHCDTAASHYLKLAMDCVFGKFNFRNEIVWCYSNSGRSKKSFTKKHDTVLLYSKTDLYHFDYQLPVSEKYLRSHYRQKDKEGRQCRIRTDGGKTRIYYPKDGVTCNDWWNDIPSLNSVAKERLGYPTQKPLALLDRIIRASSSKGDLVLDPFCGCATACVAAQRADRKWIGIDISERAFSLVNARLMKEDDLISSVKVIHRTDIPQRKKGGAQQRHQAHALWSAGRHLQRVRGTFSLPQHDDRPYRAEGEGRRRPRRQLAAAVPGLQQPERERDDGGAESQAHKIRGARSWWTAACTAICACKIEPAF